MVLDVGCHSFTASCDAGSTSSSKSWACKDEDGRLVKAMYGARAAPGYGSKDLGARGARWDFERLFFHSSVYFKLESQVWGRGRSWSLSDIAEEHPQLEERDGQRKLPR